MQQMLFCFIDKHSLVQIYLFDSFHWFSFLPRLLTKHIMRFEIAQPDRDEKQYILHTIQQISLKCFHEVLV